MTPSELIAILPSPVIGGPRAPETPLEDLDYTIAQAVSMVGGMHSHRLCHLTAGVGMLALRRLTGQDWGIGAGSVSVAIEEGRNPMAVEMDASNPVNLAREALGQEWLEFHFWNIWVRGDLKQTNPEGMRIEGEDDDRLILVDFASRYFPELCPDLGLTYTRQDIGFPFAGQPVALANRKRCVYEGEPGLAERLLKPNLAAVRELFEYWEAIALHRFNQSGFAAELEQDILARAAAVRATPFPWEGQS